MGGLGAKREYQEGKQNGRNGSEGRAKAPETPRHPKTPRHFRPNSQITAKLQGLDGKTYEIKLSHTFNDQQIAWFKAGSSLNLIASKNV